MRLYLAAFAALSTLLLCGAASAADRSPASTRPAVATTTATRSWSGRNGDWRTTGTTTFKSNGAKFSDWTSRNRTTGEVRRGSGDRGPSGQGAVIIQKQNRFGGGTRTLSTKVTGRPRITTTTKN